MNQRFGLDLNPNRLTLNPEPLNGYIRLFEHEEKTGELILTLKTWSSLRAGSRARSEKIGCAENICHGMLEYWNVGILKPRV